MDVAAYRNTDDHGASPLSVGSVAIRSNLVAKVLQGRPDVVSKLDFHDRFEPCRGKSYGGPNDGSFSQWRIEAAIRTERGRQLSRSSEYTTFSARHILTVYQHAVVALHFFVEGMVDGIDHHDGFS